MWRCSGRALDARESRRRVAGGGGGLGDILGQVLGGGTHRAPAVAWAVCSEQMQRAGFGDQARSWVSTGQNMPISPDASGQIFGEGGLEEIARRANLTPQQTSEGLSQPLPESSIASRRRAGADYNQLARSVDDLVRRMGT